MKKFIGISLPEVLVGVTLVGMIGAVAIPSYVNYIIGTKVLDGVLILSQYKDEVEFLYNKTGSINHNIYGNRGFYPITQGAIVDYDGSVNDSDKKSLYVQSLKYTYESSKYVIFNLKFKPSSTGLEAGKNNLYYGCVVNPNTEELYCYCGANGADSVPSDYLPKNCSNANISTALATAEAINPSATP